jgi:hypothetical protein
MSKESRTRVAGVSALEIVFGIAILVLLGVSIVAFIRRDRQHQAELATEAWEEQFVDLAQADDTASRTTAGGYRSAPHMDEIEESATIEQERAPTYRASAYASSATSADLPSELSGALAVTGNPDWRRVLALVRKLDPEQFPAAWSLMQEQPWSQEKQDAIKSFIQHWARLAPSDAIDFALSLESSHQRRAAYGTALETWASADPEGALAWYTEQQAQGDEGAKHIPLSRFLSGLYASQPETALEMIWELDDPRKQSQLLGSLFLSSEEDKALGADQLKSLLDASEDPDQRRLLADMVADVWAARDPMRAIAWAAELDDDPDVQQAIYMSAAEAWGRREPEAAMAWLEAQDLDAISPRTLGRITQSWGHDNPTSLQAWLDTTEPSSMRDAVVTARISSLRYRDPASAIALAESISDTSNRHRSIASVVSRWMRTDRNAAVAAALASSMPPEMKRPYAMRVVPNRRRRQ